MFGADYKRNTINIFDWDSYHLQLFIKTSYAQTLKSVLIIFTMFFFCCTAKLLYIYNIYRVSCRTYEKYEENYIRAIYFYFNVFFTFVKKSVYCLVSLSSTINLRQTKYLSYNSVYILFLASLEHPCIKDGDLKKAHRFSSICFFLLSGLNSTK